MHQLARAIVQGLPAYAALTAEQRQQAGRVLDVCCTVIAGKFHPNEISSDFYRIRVECGPWLDTLRKAIDSADIDPLDRAAMLAAFQMARVILFDAEDRRNIKKLGYVP